ncbi:hypothetical protein [Gimesia sp.]|uniref:hypothetical protein n=1 Tax=Gimesia sp. TaxID=2024833 RepID=UPI000C5CBB72|nr:hypothetical protein [Gimesia sp.]MAX35404.1 hypothetical protein [Gimesia sp.]|tara:strand:- start:34256 stop:37768 length:3513 start_codon:yes stop_codon:yes gene_type:complete
MRYLRRAPRFLLFSFIACFCLGISVVSFAQSSVEADKPATSPDNKEADWDRLIYIPFKNIKDVFNKSDATIFMPYLEYLELWARSAGPGTDQELNFPAKAVVTSSSYQAEIQENVARIQCDLTIQVLGDPWVEVPLQFGEAAIGKVSSPKSKVFLRGTGKGSYTLLLSEKGEHQIQIELLTRVKNSPEGRSFEFVCPTVGITTLELLIPEADQSVKITPQLVRLPTSSPADATRVKSTLGATGQISALWYPRESSKPEMDLLASVENSTLVSIRDGLVYTQATLKYDVLRGDMQSARIAVPLNDRILDLTSSNTKIKSWKVEKNADRQVVLIEFLNKLQSGASLQIHTEKEIPEEPFSILGLADSRTDGIHALDVIRESGQIAIIPGESMTFTVTETSGVTRSESAGVPESIQRPDAVYYRFFNPSARLQIKVQPLEARIFVSQLSECSFGEDEIRLGSQLTYDIQRAGIFSFQLKVPEQLEIDSVNVAGLKEYNFDKQSRMLTIALQQKYQGQLKVQIRAHRDLEKIDQESTVNVPLLEPVNVERETGQVAIFAPEAMELIISNPDVIGAQPSTASSRLKSGNLSLASMWDYNRRPVEIPVQIRIRPTRLVADVATSVDVKEQIAEVTSRIHYQVQYAGVDTFRFAVPEAIADLVQIRSLSPGPAPSIKQKSRSEQAVDGWVIWTVTTQRSVQGPYVLEVRYDITPGLQATVTSPEAGEKAAEETEGEKNKETEPEKKKPVETAEGDIALKEIVLSPLKVLGLVKSEGDSRSREVSLSRVYGEIAVQKSKMLSVTTSELDEQLDPIDIRELKLLPQEGFLAFRYFNQPVTLELASTRHKIQDVVETIILKSLVEVVVSKEGRSTYRCRYLMKSSERQQLKVALPAGMEPLSITVAGQPVPLEKADQTQDEEGWSNYFVNVARDQASDQSFLVSLLFTKAVPRITDSFGGNLNLPLPRIGGVKGENVVVQQLKTAIWVPDQYALVNVSDDFQPEYEPYLDGVIPRRGGTDVSGNFFDSWIGASAGSLIDFPTEGRTFIYTRLGDSSEISVSWWKLSFYTWVLSSALIVIAFVMRKTPWENKVAVLIFLVFILAMIGLTNADMVLHGLYVARFGILALLAIWILYSLAGLRSVQPATYPNTQITSGGQTAAVIPPPEIFDEFEQNRSDKEL